MKKFITVISKDKKECEIGQAFQYDNTDSSRQIIAKFLKKYDEEFVNYNYINNEFSIDGEPVSNNTWIVFFPDNIYGENGITYLTPTEFTKYYKILNMV